MDGFERLCVVTLQPLAAAADVSRTNVTPPRIPAPATIAECPGERAGRAVTHSQGSNKAKSQPRVQATICTLHNSAMNDTAEHLEL